MKVYLNSIGCRLNHSEIEHLGRQLLVAGHELVSDPQLADKVVINSCAVTSEAARDARQKVRRIHRVNETAEILMTGCYATIAPADVALVEGMSQVVLNKDKEQLLQILDPTAAIDLPLFDQEPILRQFQSGNIGHTRAFIKAQDGCNNKCTFCVTTIARGEAKSRHLGDIVAEIQALTDAGYQEAVLTGVHLGSYGHDFGNQAGLRDLIASILKHTDIPRLRISSLEPWDLAPDFFSLWEDKRVLPHLHMPLQSGSDRILKKMARRTNQKAFQILVDAAREGIPNLNLSTDLIVGFPGERERDFAESLAYVEQIGFSRIHAFTYSMRPGTAAAEMKGHLPKKVKKERVGQLIELGNRLSTEFHQQFAGTEMTVLWENATGAGPDGVEWVGYTDNYIRVHGAGGVDWSNKLMRCRLSEPTADGMRADLIV